MNIYRPHTVGLLILCALFYFGGALFIVALHYTLSPKVSSLARDALELSLRQIEVGRMGIQLAFQLGEAINQTTSGATHGMTQTTERNLEYLRHLQRTSMNEVVRSIEERVNATVNVMNGLLLAWEKEFLTTCNMDVGNPPLSNTVDFLALFMENARLYDGFFRYIWFDEPATDNRSHWVDCGWAADAADPLYAMGNDQIWYYWSEDPSISNETIISRESEPYALEEERQVVFIMSGQSGWMEAEVYLDVATEQLYLLSSFIAPVYQNETLMGLFGISLETAFLNEALRRGMPTPISTVFVIDVSTSRIVAHTDQNMPLYPNTAPPQNESDWTPSLPFNIFDLPDPLTQAAAKALVSKYGSLHNVNNSDLLVPFGGTDYVLVTHVFYHDNLHWLACQLTDRAYFSYELVQAAAQTLRSTEDAREAVSKTSAVLTLLDEAAIAADQRVDDVLEVIHKVFRTMYSSIGLVGALFAAVVIAMVLMVVFVVRPVHVLAQEMDAVATLRLEGEVARSSAIAEIHLIWQCFGVMVQHLAVYKQFLPQVVASPGLLGSEEEGHAPFFCSPPMSESLRSPQIIEQVPSVASFDSPLPRDVSVASYSQEENPRGMLSSPVNPLELSTRSTQYNRSGMNRSRRRQSQVLAMSLRGTCVSNIEPSPSCQYATILCANLSGTHRMLECFTSNMIIRNVAVFLEFVLEHKSDGLPFSELLKGVLEGGGWVSRD